MPKVKSKSPKTIRQNKKKKYAERKLQLSKQKTVDAATKMPDPIVQTQETAGFPVLQQRPDDTTALNPVPTTNNNNNNLLILSAKICNNL